MTREEAIEVLAQDLPCETDEDLREAMTMASKSLEAWGKIKKEIDEATEMLPDGDFYIKNFDVKRIIDKHLAEVEE